MKIDRNAPQSRVDGASSLLPEVGKYPGPMEDASLDPRQSPLRLTELTFGVSHTPAPDLEFYSQWPQQTRIAVSLYFREQSLAYFIPKPICPHIGDWSFNERCPTHSE